MKTNDSATTKSLRLALSFLALASGWAYGETTIRDNYYVAGKVRPIIGIQAADTGKWVKSPYVASLGLEKIPGSKKRGIYGYNLVLDVSRMEGVIPASCVQRFEQPWDSIRAKFPIWPTETKRDFPPAEELWKGRQDAQRFEFSSQGCSVRLWVGNVVQYGKVKLANGTPPLSEDYPGLSGKDFPNLFINNALSVEVTRGRVEFTAKNQRTEIDFVAHHEDIPNLGYVPPP
ncbi:MAG: hypothetical protein Q8L56_02450 [Rhodocyclaceae bacterium]|nr:hypothetical protein [Rhodocyclaceae bacterium]